MQLSGGRVIFVHCTVGVLVCFSVPVPLERVVCVYPRSFFFYRSIRSTILSFSLFFSFFGTCIWIYYIGSGWVSFLFWDIWRLKSRNVF